MKARFIWKNGDVEYREIGEVAPEYRILENRTADLQIDDPQVAVIMVHRFLLSGRRDDGSFEYMEH